MRLNYRLFGHIEDGRKCLADLSVYIQDDAERKEAVMEASKDAIWLLQEPGWPDIPNDSIVTVDNVEDLDAEKKFSAKRIAPGVMMGSGPPGSLSAFLKHIGLIEEK